VARALVSIVSDDRQYFAGMCGIGPGPSPEQLVAEADHALYRAKRVGRDRVCISAPVCRIRRC
jgi:GGDEF domain-containing protein